MLASIELWFYIYGMDMNEYKDEVISKDKRALKYRLA